MDYLKFHELEREPFQNGIDARFYFESSVHAHARVRLVRGLVQRRGLLALVGSPGCGKSTLIHQIAAALDPARHCTQLRVIPHEACAEGWLLPKVAQSFGSLDASSHPARCIEQIHHALLASRGLGRHPVLILDEAQLLSTPEVMREFRGLLNLMHDGQPLLSIVLCGLADLDRVLALDASLNQRVEVRCSLAPLRPEEVASYVAHRIACAGGTQPVFDADAVAALARCSEGIPRVLNALADNALFESALAGVRPVTAAVVLEAAAQLGLQSAASPVAAAPGASAAVAAPAAQEPVVQSAPAEEPVADWMQPLAAPIEAAGDTLEPLTPADEPIASDAAEPQPAIAELSAESGPAAASSPAVEIQVQVEAASAPEIDDAEPDTLLQLDPEPRTLELQALDPVAELAPEPESAPAVGEPAALCGETTASRIEAALAPVAASVVQAEDTTASGMDTSPEIELADTAEEVVLSLEVEPGPASERAMPSLAEEDGFVDLAQLLDEESPAAPVHANGAASFAPEVAAESKPEGVIEDLDPSADLDSLFDRIQR